MRIDSGNFKKGDFAIGYFDQQRESLDDEKNLLETFCPNGGDRVVLQDGRNMHVFGYLKNFLFPREYLDKKVGVLSGGEKNRVALALLFTKKVDCLILDEPTKGFDPVNRRLLMNIVEERKQAGATIVFVSHQMDEVEKLCDRIILLKDGKSAAYGTVDEVKKRFGRKSMDDVFIEVYGGEEMEGYDE